jgi:hypothetical protein
MIAQQIPAIRAVLRHPAIVPERRPAPFEAARTVAVTGAD